MLLLHWSGQRRSVHRDMHCFNKNALERVRLTRYWLAVQQLFSRAIGWLARCRRIHGEVTCECAPDAYHECV